MIRILCVGKIKENYLREMINDYLKRINKYHKIIIEEIKDDVKVEKEWQALKQRINPKHYNIALDLEGSMLESVALAKKIDNIFNNYSTITFVIGGSTGLNDEIRNMCQEVISFSKFTFPHGLFRGILLEQIYRAFKINNHETYHK